MAQGNDQIRIFLLFQLSHQFLVPFGGKLAGVVFRTMAATFLRNGFEMLVIFCVSTQTQMPVWRAEKPRETS